MTDVAVIGLGAVGRIHAKNLLVHETAQLSAVCDPRPMATSEFSETDTLVFSNVEDLLDTGPEAVIISSSTATHGDIVGQCVEAGIPFLCEKPLAQDIETAARIVASAESKGLVAATALNRRFDSQYTAIRNAAVNGEIGQCELYCFTSRSTSPPTVEFSRTSGGLFAEKGSHFFDLARWMSGAEPVELSAMGSVMIDPGFVEIGEVDTAVIAMRMDNGALCRFDFSWRTAYGQDERIEVHGENGLLTSHQAHVGTDVMSDGRMEKSAHVLATWQERFAPTYKRELDAFLGFLASGKPHPVLATLSDGLRAQRIGEAAKTSAKGGAVIKLNS